MIQKADDEQMGVTIEDGIDDCDSGTHVYGRSSTNPNPKEIRYTEIFRTELLDYAWAARRLTLANRKTIQQKSSTRPAIRRKVSGAIQQS